MDNPASFTDESESAANYQATTKTPPHNCGEKGEFIELSDTGEEGWQCARCNEVYQTRELAVLLSDTPANQSI